MHTYWCTVVARPVQSRLLFHVIHPVSNYHCVPLVLIVLRFSSATTSLACQLRKRKRAISVDHLNDQKDEPLHAEDTNDAGKSNMNAFFDRGISMQSSSTSDAVEKNATGQINVAKSLKFLCVNLGECRASMYLRLWHCSVFIPQIP